MKRNESEKPIPWIQLLRISSDMDFLYRKSDMTDPIWWFYLFWIPGWLSTVRGAGLDIKSFGLPLVVIYSRQLQLEA
jgi:ACS family hexuronate transporter-like MFS transporter